MRMLPVLPDESLFSRFCRTTTVYGMSPSSLLTIIFNKPDMNVHPILNSGLKAISLHRGLTLSGTKTHVKGFWS
ncbi:hypothetical protein DLN69_23460 [Salmonella enterica]|nr:hypothetical protein [Salmonella enterica]EAA1640493.1 hypothetical protein [Salmonella enterica]EAA5008296.1 hypothetical protein [Salmonella enterica]EAA5008987.1 hypothetical protein [Salmonella enterica]EAM3036307.1 hypothetical protein [Salmonella enterica]